MESPSSSPRSGSPSGNDLARLRRERREAKIRAGGSARLGKITSMSGRPAEPVAATQATKASPAAASPSTNDPDEVDISEHYYRPASTPRTPQPSSQSDQAPQLSEEQLRQMMASLDRTQAPGAGPQGPSPFPFPGSGAPQPPGVGGEDPMTQMLQQMLGGMGGGGPGAAPGGPGGVNPSDLLSQMMGQGMSGLGPEPAEPGMEQYAYIWRIVHALFALVLGAYTIAATSFTGAKGERERHIEGDVGRHFFWLFATGELLLQSSRFFLERGQMIKGKGWLSSIAALLPEPWKSRVAVALRYSAIYTTLVGDAMVVVFMLGCVAWWNQR